MNSNLIKYLVRTLIRDINSGSADPDLDLLFFSEIMDEIRIMVNDIDDRCLLVALENNTQSKVLINIAGRKTGNREIMDYLLKAWQENQSITLCFNLLNDPDLRADIKNSLHKYVENNFEDLVEEESLYENFTGQNIDSYLGKLTQRTKKTLEGKKWIYAYSALAHPAINREKLDDFISENDIKLSQGQIEFLHDKVNIK